MVCSYPMLLRQVIRSSPRAQAVAVPQRRFASNSTSSIPPEFQTNGIEGGRCRITKVPEEVPKLPDDAYAVFRDALVGDVLKAKGADVYNIKEDETVLRAIQFMADHCIGCVLVSNTEGKITGIFTERDYMRRVVLQGLRSHTTSVKTVMSTNLETVTADESLVHCLRIMTRNRFRHLPVQDTSGTFVGLVSIGDLVAGIIGEYRHTIENLRDFIERKW